MPSDSPFRLQPNRPLKGHWASAKTFNHEYLARLSRNQNSEYLAQRRKGRKEKDSELGVLGVLARE
jgi:hypothetical protein